MQINNWRDNEKIQALIADVGQLEAAAILKKRVLNPKELLLVEVILKIATAQGIEQAWAVLNAEAQKRAAIDEMIEDYFISAVNTKIEFNKF